MLSVENMDREGRGAVKGITGSSSESERRRERIEQYKDARRREMSAKYGPGQDANMKSYKSTRKKDIRGNSTCGPFLSSFSNSHYTETQVPLDSVRRTTLRRDENKTDSTSGNSDDICFRDSGNKNSQKESVVVRETKASRLRAARKSSASDGGLPSLKSPKNASTKPCFNDKTSCLSSTSCNSLPKKLVDKSYARKSHLNRSHTCEEVNTADTNENSSLRRRREKNIRVQASPNKSDSEKFVSPISSTSISKEETKNVSHIVSPRFVQKSPSPLKKPLNTEKLSLKTTPNEEDKLKEKKDGKKVELNEKSFLNDESCSETVQKKLSLSGSSSSRKFSTSTDVATRAEILTASTLKMIKRLDEINKKSKKPQGSLLGNNNEVSKDVLPLNTVIKSFKISNSSKTSAQVQQPKVEVKRISSQNDKNSLRSLPRRNMNIPSTASSTTDISNSQRKIDFVGNFTKDRSAPVEIKEETNKPSILKNKHSLSFDDSQKSKPISILKRKSISHDENQTSSSPVTFSPLTLKKKNDPKRQGILKKRRSLDESEVLRRHSHSPDMNFSDVKSILKNQRRSSMEELTRRPRSPELGPQGILKRKSSKEEETEEFSGGIPIEPQGILKRNSLSASQQQVKVKVTESVTHPLGGATTESQPSESVRPILKKKSSSEEHSTSDVSLTDAPKSILKKKTSLESDEGEDKPKKPILKTVKVSSLEEPEDSKSQKSFIFGTLELDSVKSILKRENSKNRLPEARENSVVVRRVLPTRHERPHSSSDIDFQLNSGFLKRRSLEYHPLDSVVFDSDLRKQKEVPLNESNLPEPLSLTDNHHQQPSEFLFENSLENKSPVDEIVSSCRKILENSLLNSAATSSENNEYLLGDKSTSLTSTNYSGSNSTLDYQVPDEMKSIYNIPSANEGNDSSSTTSTYYTSFQGNCEDLATSLEEKLLGNLENGKSVAEFTNEHEVAKQLFRQTSFCSSDSDQTFVSELGDRDDSKNFPSLDSCENQFSDLCLKDSSNETGKVMNEKISKSPYLLERSGSVSAKKSLFQEMENKLKAAKESDVKKVAKGTNSYVRKRQAKKFLEANADRFHTQPVSSEEVESAVRKAKANSKEKANDQDEKHEDELSALSYSERLRLFESSVAQSTSESVPKKRGSRFRTQPVTTVEIEKAKNQRFLSSSATDDKKVSQDDFSDVEDDSTNIKNESDHKINIKPPLGTLVSTYKPLIGELKSILKQPPPDNTSSCKRVESLAEKTNLAAILQKVEPVTFREKFLNKGGGLPEGRRVPKYLRNEGIAREINKSRNNSVIKSHSHSSVSNAVESGFKCGRENGAESEEGDVRKDETDLSCLRVESGLRRSTTQPFVPSENTTDDDMSGASIQERLARLKKNGELNWQKRKSQVTNVENELSIITAGNYLFKENNCLEKRSPSGSPPSEESKIKRNEDGRNSILADRLGKLDAAKEGWKKRVKPSDAIRFSVEGKMGTADTGSSPPKNALQFSPGRNFSGRERRSPKAIKFKSKQFNPSLSSVPSSPLEESRNPIARSVSAPGSCKNGLFSLSISEQGKESPGPVVTVPKYDDETFTSFFNRLGNEKESFQEILEIRDEDLDVITKMKSSQLLVQKRNIQTQRRRATVRNPLKSLAARLELQEYREVKTGVVEKELKRIKIEKATKNSNLAIEALAGLASHEDFTAINLKKASEGVVGSPDAPFTDLMLLQVKGRRHVQTRLVEPIASNVNSGDCFVLVTPNKVFHYVGEYSNVIERSRSSEIALYVQQKGDLGCSTESVIKIGENGKATSKQMEEFWRLLGGKGSDCRGPGNPDEDELFESALVCTNMVYELVEDELVPNEIFWGSVPKIEILDPNKILIFDFGSEFYVWNGKNVHLTKRRIAMKLAKELWEEGYDYTDCDVCPLTAASYLGNCPLCDEVPESSKAGPVRPSWALFAKITQNMETILFREKFLDWPDYSRVIKRNKKEEENNISEGNAFSDLKMCDSMAMLENSVSEPDLVIEGNHLGRGVRYFEEERRRCSEITTKGVTVWHIKEYEYSEVNPKSFGQFHMEDSYVIRWHYSITLTGRELNGQPSKHVTTGRDRYAYFCWQGENSPINDKGAAACLTVELDKEHGPQVRVVQGFEPPAFLNLFQGGMVVHSGRRFSDNLLKVWRLFICRNETENESVLFEVPCSMRHLRSIGSFILVNREEGKIFVWHGCKSKSNLRKVSLSAAKRIQSRLPKEFGFEELEVTIVEEEEGRESKDFLKGLGGDNRQLYFSLLKEETFEDYTPRLFHFTSVSGEFLFTEIASPYSNKDTRTTFPFLQNDLYSASQPALFLLDVNSCLWLWQGWWDGDSEDDRGSGNVRFQAERKAAMLTVMSYWVSKYGDSTPKAYLVWAGLEPLIFTNHFPFWSDRDDIAEINMTDGKKPGEAAPIKAELETLTRSFYPLSCLQNRPLPDGVNPTSLEDYLKPECFQELFGIDREEFFKLPSWKKKKLKQEAGLF